MPVHIVKVDEASIHRMKDESTRGVIVKSLPGLVVGDLVQFEYNEGDVTVARPPSPVYMIRNDIAHLDPEEAFLQAQRRWRREERDNEIERKKKLGAPPGAQTVQSHIQ